MGVLRAVPWWAYIAVFLVLWRLNKATGNDRTSGQVTGIVGRMGSGKSYMATRIAYRRMLRGARIVTNFTMKLECPPSGHRRRKCPCKLAGQWERFHDWPDLLGLSNAVIIIDEADLFAPSHDYHAITDEVRWKLKMARKYRLDVYWIAQHETRVNRILREVLTNEIAVCTSWFGGRYFTAKFYEPTQVRRARKHLARVGYWLNVRVANLYDTLEVIEGSAYSGDETMARANTLSREHNRERGLEVKQVSQLSERRERRKRERTNKSA